MDERSVYAEPRLVTDPAECLFYHHMELPGLGQVGEGWDLRETVDDYLGHVEVAGRRVLDVGAASGFLTFTMERRGATVVSFDLPGPEAANMVPYAGGLSFERVVAQSGDYLRRYLNSYWLAHRLYGSAARMHYGDVYALPEALGRFDVVVLGMILPHLRDPFLALQSAARRCADTLVVTQQAPRGDGPFAIFMPDPRKDLGNIEHYFAWWALGERCLANMLGVLGFQVASARRALHKYTTPMRGEPGYEECLTLVARRAA